MDQSEDERRGLGTAFVGGAARRHPNCSRWAFLQHLISTLTQILLILLGFPDEASAATWAFVKTAFSGPNWPHPWARDNLSPRSGEGVRLSRFLAMLRAFFPWLQACST